MTNTIKNRIRSALIGIAIVLGLSATAAISTTTPAYAQDIDGSVNCGSDISLGTGCKKPDAAGGKIEGLLKTVINVFSAIVGSIAVIMVIVGGFRYVTSGGDSNNVSGAKNTILYAIVGLIIVAFAQILVRFVLQRI